VTNGRGSSTCRKSDLTEADHRRAEAMRVRGIRRRISAVSFPSARRRLFLDVKKQYGVLGVRELQLLRDENSQLEAAGSGSFARSAFAILARHVRGLRNKTSIPCTDSRGETQHNRKAVHTSSNKLTYLTCVKFLCKPGGARKIGPSRSHYTC
jgi:hypothetical protein